MKGVQRQALSPWSSLEATSPGGLEQNWEKLDKSLGETHGPLGEGLAPDGNEGIARR